jgi:RNA polymerase sigma-70 factor (ECF subfamily)
VREDPAEVTRLLEEARAGDEQARGELFERLEGELRRLARHYMRGEGEGHLLQTTALLNEAWLRLARGQLDVARNRVHFLAIAAEAMRRVLVDEARQRRARKRGGSQIRRSLDSSGPEWIREEGESLFADAEVLHHALQRMEADPRQREKARVVELRFFGGLSIEDTARALELSPATVKRHWEFARAWLRREVKRMLEGG